MSDTQPKSQAKSHGRKSISASLQPRDLMASQSHLAQAWQAQVITLVPQVFPGVLGESLTGKALKDGTWQLDTIDLRQFGDGKHRNVDDTPSGGGAGMVLRADVMGLAVEYTLSQTASKLPLIYLSPRGRPFDQKMAQDLSRERGVILVCGRFEGLDQRAIDHYDMQEVSLGDFVMTGAEIAAQAVLDSCVRLLPGVLGNAISIEDESHSNGLLEHPQYTRPAEWQGLRIPDILNSGHHAQIASWRKAYAEELTKTRRPDLWNKYKAEAEKQDSEP